MFSLDYIFSKMVFLNTGFLAGFIWIRIFVFLFSLLLLVPKSFRREIFSQKLVQDKKSQALFIYTQTCGSIAIFLQSFAISLAPLYLLALLNSLRGLQYVFLLILTIAVSLFFPKILRESFSKRIILQKAFSIALITVGLVLLIV